MDNRQHSDLERNPLSNRHTLELEIGLRVFFAFIRLIGPNFQTRFFALTAVALHAGKLLDKV